MSVKSAKSPEQIRKDRLARQLRENLKRRKAQARNFARVRNARPQSDDDKR